MLTEHLAYYADRNTDNRGRAGYWAARDSERASLVPPRPIDAVPLPDEPSRLDA